MIYHHSTGFPNPSTALIAPVALVGVGITGFVVEISVGVVISGIVIGVVGSLVVAS